MFEPLYSGRINGVGLGLPLVRRIMEQRGGGVRLDETPGGASFTLWMPQTPSAASGAA